MSLATPEKIRILQKKLYEKAKREPEYRKLSQDAAPSPRAGNTTI